MCVCVSVTDQARWEYLESQEQATTAQLSLLNSVVFSLSCSSSVGHTNVLHGHWTAQLQYADLVCGLQVVWVEEEHQVLAWQGRERESVQRYVPRPRFYIPSYWSSASSSNSSFHSAVPLQKGAGFLTAAICKLHCHRLASSRHPCIKRYV